MPRLTLLIQFHTVHYGSGSIQQPDTRPIHGQHQCRRLHQFFQRRLPVSRPDMLAFCQPHQRMLVSLQHCLTATQRRLRFRTSRDVQHEGEHAGLSADADRLDIEQPVPHLAGFRAELFFQMSQKPVSPQYLGQVPAILRIHPDSDVERGHADQLFTGKSGHPHERLIHVEHPAVLKSADRHPGRTAVKRLGKPLLAFAQRLLDTFPLGDIPGHHLKAADDAPLQ